MAGRQIPDLNALKNFRVNRAGQYEAITASLYDTATYASAGQTILAFFQTPNGQAGKTYAETNMDLSGQIPNPKYFLVESVEVRFMPSAMPEVATATASFTSDAYTFDNSGYLNFRIGSKDYITDAPMGRFPPKTRLSGFAAAATTTAATNIIVDYAAASGRPYMLAAPLLIEPTQNFVLNLIWPVAVPLPSGSNATVKVILDGVLYRESQ